MAGVANTLVWVYAAILSGAVPDDMAIPGQMGVMAGNWHFSNGTEVPDATGTLQPDGEDVWLLRYDFRHGGDYVAACCELNKPAALRSVSFRIRKCADALLALRVTDDAGQTFEKPLVYGHAHWQRVECNMEDWAAHWGGANDGILRPPLHGMAILVKNTDLREPQGEILIADVDGETEMTESIPTVQSATLGEFLVTDLGMENVPVPAKNSTFAAGTWDIDFAKTNEAVISPSLSLFGKPTSLGITVSGGRTGNVLRLRIYSHFQEFTRTLGQLDGGEQTFTIPMPPEGWTRSGEDEHEILYPLRLGAFILQRGDAPATSTHVRIVHLRCVTRITPSERLVLLASAHDDGLHQGQRAAHWNCTFWNLTSENLTGTLAFTLRNWEDQTLYSESNPFTIPARGRCAVASLQKSIPASLRFADAEFRFEAPGFAPATARATLTSPVLEGGTAALSPQSPWGMGVYLYRYHDSTEMERVATMAQAAGVKWTREEFTWNRIERERDTFDFTFYDNLADTAQRHGMSICALLTDWAEWTRPYTEEGITDFCHWARATVRHFKDRIKYWEIYNEPNVSFWQGPKELYPVLVKACYAAIKEADPQATVLALSTSRVDRAFIQQCMDAGMPFDILAIHPYRPILNEHGFITEMRSASALAGGRPIWITEMGWSTNPGAVSERTQAQLLARSYLAAIATGVVNKICWYDFCHDDRDPFYNTSNCDVVRFDLTPKAAYRALATVCHALGDGKTRVPTHLPQDLFALATNQTTTLWVMERPMTVDCRVEKGELHVLNLMGETIDVPRERDQVAIHLRPGNPVFLSNARVSILGENERDEAVAEPAVIRF